MVEPRRSALKGEKPARKVELYSNFMSNGRGLCLKKKSRKNHNYLSYISFVGKQEMRMHGSNLENKDLYTLCQYLNVCPVRALRKLQVQNKHSSSAQKKDR